MASNSRAVATFHQVMFGVSPMRLRPRLRRFAVLAALPLVFAPGAVARAASAGAPSSYYLALGDSVPVWNSTSSYPYLILARHRRQLPQLRLDDIAVSGETTGSMLDRQYPQALEFLRAHRRHIALITIDIGGNDVLGCVSPSNVDSNSPCSRAARATIRRNLQRMLSGLRRAAPSVPILGMTYYDPILGDWLAGDGYRSFALATIPGLLALNRELTELYGGARNTADVQGAFRATDFQTMVSSPWGRIPIAVQRACAWLDIQCHQGAQEGFGDDPNTEGAVQIAGAFEARIKRLCVSRSLGLFRRC